MSAEGYFDLLQENYRVISFVLTLACGMIVLRLLFRGGTCFSKARLDNKTVLITGANTGIGKETAIDLAKRGARVLLACRDKQRAQTAAEEIKVASNSKDVAVYILDLASLKSVRDCAQQVISKEPHLDILINNAGVMFCPNLRTEDGFEMQLGTNHLGHFLFTNLLVDMMKKSAPSRIINVSSRAHTRGYINFDDINSEKKYSRMAAYSQSKLANNLFTRELSKRLQGTNVTVCSLHPGVVDTELIRWMDEMLFPPFSYLFRFTYHGLIKHTMKTSVEGAQTSIHCAVDPDVVNQSGKYFSDCAVKKEAKQALDDEAAAKLWTLSEKMVGLNQK